MAQRKGGRKPRTDGVQPPPRTARRREAWRSGRWAESLAVWRLRLTGHRILARNWRSPVGEIDIIAQRGRLLVIVEVKRRPDFALALAAISPRQQARLVRAAQAFQAGRTDCAGLTLRFDVIVFAGSRWMNSRWPRHLKEAWRPAGD